jgi:ketol-acid reductoisomerase
LKNVTEVIDMLYEGGLSVVEGNVTNTAEVKDVQKEFTVVQDNVPEGQEIFSVYQKKKGKPTKKVTAFAIAHDGHVTRLMYALLTSDVDFRELIRSIKNKNS